MYYIHDRESNEIHGPFSAPFAAHEYASGLLSTDYRVVKRRPRLGGYDNFRDVPTEWRA